MKALFTTALLVLVLTTNAVAGKVWTNDDFANGGYAYTQNYNFIDKFRWAYLQAKTAYDFARSGNCEYAAAHVKLAAETTQELNDNNFKSWIKSNPQYNQEIYQKSNLSVAYLNKAVEFCANR